MNIKTLTAAEFDELRKVLLSASHALKSYAYGNASPDLATRIADRIDALLIKHGKTDTEAR